MKKLKSKYLIFVALLSLNIGLTFPNTSSAATIVSTKDDKNNIEIKLKVKNIGEDLNIDEKSTNASLKNVDESSLNSVTDNVATFVSKDFIDKLKSISKDKILKSLKDDLDNSKYVLIYGKNIKKLEENEITSLLGIQDTISTKPVDDTAKNAHERIVSYGFVKDANNQIHIETFYGQPDLNDYKINKKENFELVVKGVEEGLGMKEEVFNKFVEKDKIITQSVTDSPDYTYSKTWDFGKYGKFQSTTYMERVAKKSTYSIWDVKQANTTTAGYQLYSSSWATVDYLSTRMDISRFGAEITIDHGPTTTNHDNSASVSLSADGADVGWSYSVPDVDIIDTYNPPKYARWEHDYWKYKNPARNSFKTQPGGRFTNSSGNFAVDLSNVITYFDEMYAPFGNSGDKQTGVWTYIVADR